MWGKIWKPIRSFCMAAALAGTLGTACVRAQEPTSTLEQSPEGTVRWGLDDVSLLSQDPQQASTTTDGKSSVPDAPTPRINPADSNNWLGRGPAPCSVGSALSFIKTSYTRNINDWAASSIDNVPVRFWALSYGSGTSSAGLLVHSGPARISSSKILPCVSSCSLFTPSALAGDSLLTQAVLGRIAKVLGSMEGTSHPGDTQNRCRLASCRFSALLKMPCKSQVEGRSKADEQTDSSLNFSNGCGKSNLGSAPHSWRVAQARLRSIGTNGFALGSASPKTSRSRQALADFSS